MAEAQESTYLDCVVKESLRILPPVVFALRRMARAGTILGHALTEGTNVYPGIYVTHHQAETFAEPERFLPERWLANSVSPYAYLPFGAGPRMCLGTAFSLQLFKIVVPAFLSRFRLALQPNTRVDRHSNLTLGIRGELPAQLLPQDGRFYSVPLTGNIHEMVQMPQPATIRRAA
jgi:cytochrome P450